MVGTTAVIQGGLYLVEESRPGLDIWLVGLLMVASGIALLIGFLTPLAGGVVALTTVGIALSWFPAPAANLFNSPLPAILVAIVGASLAFLGPGALSVDSRLFGRREIIIPHATRLPRP